MNFTILRLLFALSGLIALSQASKKFSCAICQHNMRLKANNLESYFGTDAKVPEDANCKAKGGTAKSCDGIFPDANMCVTIEDDKQTRFMRGCGKAGPEKAALYGNTCENVEFGGKKYKLCTCTKSNCNPGKPRKMGNGEYSSGSTKLMASGIILLIFLQLKFN